MTFILVPQTLSFLEKAQLQLAELCISLPSSSMSTSFTSENTLHIVCLTFNTIAGIYKYIKNSLNYNVEYRDGIKSKGDKILCR